MKKILLSVLLATGCSFLQAQQKPNEDSVFNLMKNEICSELEKTPASEFTADNFQMKLGMMMLTVFQNYNDALVQLYGEDYMTDKTKTYEIGKKIGINLGASCKAFQDLIMKNPGLVSAAMGNKTTDKEVTARQKTFDGPKAEAKGYTAKVISFTAGEVSYYTIKDDKNQLVKLYWLGKFEGDDELIANPSKITGKTVFFRTMESKLYNVKEKVYKKIQVIVSFAPEVIEEIIEDQVIEAPVKN